MYIALWITHFVRYVDYLDGMAIVCCRILIANLNINSLTSSKYRLLKWHQNLPYSISLMAYEMEMLTLSEPSLSHPLSYPHIPQSIIATICPTQPHPSYSLFYPSYSLFYPSYSLF